MPSTLSAMPATRSSVPGQSTLAGAPSFSSLTKAISIRARAATGTLIQKIARQVQNSVR